MKGFYCLNAKEFEDNIIDVLVLKYQSFKENEIYKENYLSIFQFIFDVTFEEDGLFIYKIVVPIMADILIDNNFNDKLKTTIFLYLNHLLINEKGFANILLSMEFFVFHEHFLCSFMQNFNLESFKFFRKNFSYNTETAKKTQENLQKVKDEKILETVSRKKGKEQNENAINQNIKNKSTAINHITIPSIIWNNENKKFEKIFKEVNEEQHAQNEKNKQDEIIGKMSKYFWRLHAFLHLLKIIQDFLKIYQSHLKDFIKEQFKDFVFQIVETCIIFNKFNDKFLPTEPFHSDTECWNEIRNILAEIMVLKKYCCDLIF